MHTTGKCPKCGSQQILKIAGNKYPNGGLDFIQGGYTFLGTVFVTRYLCIDCGFSEEWVDDADARRTLMETFPLRSPGPQ
ncbi:MAG: hypothetical protein ACREJ2_00490 [Planctomycetota bacterium]